MEWVIKVRLCSCGKNYGEQPEVVPVPNKEEDSLQAALQTFQEDSAGINTLRVRVNGQKVSLLTAAMILGENSTTIESLLEKGADIKTADQEGNGILHALVGNRCLSNQQKATLVDNCFDRADCADDIQTNATRSVRRSERSVQPLPTPWLRALEQSNSQTASTIVDHMSVEDSHPKWIILCGKEYTQLP